MRALIIFVVAILASSCSVNYVTERRTKRKVNLVHDASTDLLQLETRLFTVDTLRNIALKKKLRKLRVQKVEIYREPNSEFEGDSIIVFSKYQVFLAEGQIIYDFKKKKREELKAKWGRELIRIDDRVYFRKTPLPIS